MVQWRNTDLDFSSIGALQASLATTPAEDTMTRAPVAEDILVLDHAAREDEVRALTATRADVERLWDVCQVPDYRKIAPATHAELAVSLYGFIQREGAIPTDWFSQQVGLADRTDGDIDTLSNRIAHIRTWTFAANRPDWLADPEHWQGVTRAVEDKLSDALHERLTERFIDRRTSVLMRRLREKAELEPEMGKTGEVVVEGHAIGRLDGFVFVSDASSGGSEAKALQNAAQKALAGEISARAVRLAEAPDGQFVLAADGTVRWTGAAVGKLVAGDGALRPRVRVIADEHLSGAPREAVGARLDQWVKSHIEKLLGPLFELSAAADVTGIARGVAFQLVEALGVLERTRVADQVKGLEQPERATLRKYGVRFGAYHIYLPLLLKPAPRALAVQLYALANAAAAEHDLDDLLHLTGSGRTSIPVNRDTDATLYRTAGYRVCGERAVRVDILERLADLIRPALAWRDGVGVAKPPGAIAGGGFTVVNTMTSLTGASGEDFASILRSLGYRVERRPKPAEPEPTGTTDAPAPPIAETSALAPPETADVPVAPLGAAAPVPEIVPDGTAGASPVEAPASPDAVTIAEVAGDAPAPAEPAVIEVWRPGRAVRLEGGRRPRHRHGDAGRRPTKVGGETPPADAVPAEGAVFTVAEQTAPVAGSETDKSSKRERHPRHRRRQGGEQRFDRPRRERPAAHAARHERGERNDRKDRREKAPDPNSPFAKLAALKAQLEADAKERR